MGKGAGCIPSTAKKRRSKIISPVSGPYVDAGAPANVSLSALFEEEPAFESPDAVDDSLKSASSSPLPSFVTSKIYIVFYSMYGHVEALAKKLKEGIDSVEGVEGFLFRVPETLSPDILEKMHAPPRDGSIPVVSALELPAADGLVFGFPTRYGAMAAQMKAFFDSTSHLWEAQKLAGKPAGIFISTGTQGGGQETAAWTAITQLAHHGMLFVPIGYTFGAGMFEMDEIRGGSPYGAGTFAGDGTRIPSQVELALAVHQGKYMAAVVKRLVG